MYQKLLCFLGIVALFSCEENSKQKADAIFINATIYTVDSTFAKASAFAVKDGKFLQVGDSEEIQNEFEADTVIDVEGKTIVPGLIDAHCHFLNLGIGKLNVDLVDTKSFDEVVERVVAFQKENNVEFIQGRGWDQNDWEVKEFPDKRVFDSLFPDTPIALTRIDGHASIVNQAALDLGGVTATTKVEGGDVILRDGQPTGVLIDRAQGLVSANIPQRSQKELIHALMEAQEECFSFGLTTVNDAGLPRSAIELIDSLQKAGDLKMRVYAMVTPTDDNLDHYLNTGVVKTERLHVRSFKYYADGALGSRGALLKEPYSDAPHQHGLLLTPLDKFKTDAMRIANSDYQMNTHAIGDSANYAALSIYKEVLSGKTDRRWKIEHAQVISPNDFEMFGDIIPSIQPTHATSDMYWAEDRLGSERVKGAYAFKDLLNAYGKVALGTDFPVEKVSPFLTFYAAVARQDLESYPEDGYQMENALSREETLKGMTIWAAYSNFEEAEKGSIEKGKLADFTILDRDIMEVDQSEIPKTKVLNTYVNGEAQL